MNRRMRSTLLVAGLFAVALATSAGAQDFQVKGTSNVILHSQNIDTITSDKIAVHGQSLPQAYWGVGAQFEGGYTGVRGYATMTGAGSRFAGYFYASGGDNNYGLYSSAYGGTTQYAGYFNGNVHINGTLTQTSDARLKKEIADLPNALGQVMSLRPRTYRYRISDFPGMSLAEGKQFGLVAQEVAAVYPEIVREVVAPAEKGKTAEKFLAVDYVKLIPVLVKAIQEQQAEIEALKAQVQQLQKN